MGRAAEHEGSVSSPQTRDTPGSPVVQEHEYPSFRQSLLVTISIGLTLFCMSLDETILATAIPRITDEFQSVQDVGWYGSSYLFVLTAVQIIWGKLYTFYPSKWVFLLGVTVFEIGSLLCGLATSSAMLIAGRGIAGLGAASMNSGYIVVITHTIPLRKRPVYIGFLGCIRGVMSVAGPLLGGVLTDRASWRWCFYINLPPGGVTLLAIAFLLSPNKPTSGHFSTKEKIQAMDLLGSLFFIPGIITLLLALQWGGGSAFGWDNWRVIVLFVAAGILFMGFVGVQVRTKDPSKATLPPLIVCNRDMISIICYAVCSNGALFVFVYYLPIWFQAIKGVSATTSGLMSLPTELGLILSSLGGGVLVTLVGYYTPFLITGPIASTIGAGLLTTLHPSSGLGPTLGYQIVMSFGIGLGLQNAILVPQMAVGPEHTVMAITTFSFMQTLSSSISLAIGKALFHSRLVANLRLSAPSVQSAVIEEGATLLREKVSAAVLPGVLEAYSRSITQMFYMCVVMCGLALFASASLRWKRVPKNPAGSSSEEEGNNVESSDIVVPNKS